MNDTRDDEDLGYHFAMEWTWERRGAVLTEWVALFPRRRRYLEMLAREFGRDHLRDARVASDPG